MTMLQQLNYYWRLVATAFAFTSFGIGGAFIPILGYPLLLLSSRNPRQRTQNARWLVHITFKAFIYMMRTLGILEWRLEGVEQLKGKPTLVLANHPTLLDVVFLVALIPNASCIVKGKLLRNPAMRGFISLAGYIANEQKQHLVPLAEQVFAEGSQLIIFPEGSRTTAGQPFRLQRGAANIAIRSQTDITPVIIRCTPSTLSKEHRWYHIPQKKFVMDIRVQPRLAVLPYLEGPASKQARRLTQDLEEYFAQETQVK